jgi:hypothetical protein
MVTERGEFEGQKVRFIKSVRIPEVSPVLIGAGVNTRTLEAKSRSLKEPASQTQSALRDAGVDAYGGDGIYVWPEDYDPDEGWVVYSVYEEGETDRLVRVSYATNADGGVALGDDASDVERAVSYAPKGNKFSDHGKSVLADLAAFVTRASEVVALRAGKNKGLGDESADLLRQIVEKARALDPLLAAPPIEDEDAVREYLRFVELTSRSHAA